MKKDLTEQEVTQVIQTLATRPYGEIYQLIAKIDAQVKKHISETDHND